MEIINNDGDKVMVLSKKENLALRKALADCKKSEESYIKLNAGNYFFPREVDKTEVYK